MTLSRASGAEVSHLAASFLLLLAIALTAGAATAEAARCGDDVDGRRVPCACGDAVVSDTRIRPDDPVVTARCEGDGLRVMAPANAQSLRLDVGGNTITGQGRGTGVRVLRGGSEGAVIVGGARGEHGVVANFATGVRAGSLRSVRELRDLRLTGNARDGLRMRSLDGLVAGVSAERNGRDGLRVGGRNPRLEGVESNENGRFGVKLGARGAVVDAAAAGNRRGDLTGHGDDLTGESR